MADASGEHSLMTKQQLQDWSTRVRRVLDEIEDAESDPARGTYPSDVSMATFLAWKLLYAAARDADAAASDGERER